MTPASLIMPMAGRGSRFAKQGILEPKPLVDLGGRPFFWWATESVLRQIPVNELVFVILEEHITAWQLDDRIRDFYPHAHIHAIPEVTAGSAETADLGMAALTSTAPVIINDCDHAFVASRLGAAILALAGNGPAGALMTFHSDSPNYSYVQLAPDGAVAGTIEKVVASPFAIAGCYLFQSPQLYREQYQRYLQTCPYNELYISGIYNRLLHDGARVEKVVLDQHFAFGTPEEYAQVEGRLLDHLSPWLSP